MPSFEYTERQSRIAMQFAIGITRDVGRDKRDEAARRNDAEADPAICHSHDFCDANVCMLEAFEAVTGRAPDIQIGVAYRKSEHPTAGDDLEDWNMAWGLAKEAGFDPLDMDGAPPSRMRRAELVRWLEWMDPDGDFDNDSTSVGRPLNDGELRE